MARKLSPLDAIRLAKAVQRLPDGSKIPEGAKALLIVIATYYKADGAIFATVERFAADLSIKTAATGRRLRVLVQGGLISRFQRDGTSTITRLNFGVMWQCVAEPDKPSNGLSLAVDKELIQRPDDGSDEWGG